MTLDERRAIGLFRYGIIAPLETGATDAPSNNEYFRRAAAQTYTGPDGKPTTVGASTIEKWHLAYRKGGFDALLPQSRKDDGVSRKLSPDLQNTIRAMLEEHPRITAAAVFRTLQKDGEIAYGELSQSTVERFVRHLHAEEGFTTNKDMRRYELEHINEVWYGDTCYGPYLSVGGTKKRIYIIALIDDASRFIVGADVFFQDNFENFMQVIKSAVSKYGKPKLFQLDRGKTYHNDQMRLLVARMGSSVHYCEPYTPQSKSKIERFWSTMKMSFISNFSMKQVHSLDDFREHFHEYINQYNMTVHSSLKGLPPQERFFSEPDQIRRMTQEQIDQCFLLEVGRKVTADCVISLNNHEYLVPYRYAKQKIRLLYTPDLKTVYVAEAPGQNTPIQLLNKHANAVAKRERLMLSEGSGAK